jgi:tRNA-dihydrouridine synthase B
MAPLRGITDHLFRTLFTDHFGGFDLAVAPFISSKRDNVIKPKYIRDVLPENNLVLPVIPQILSKSARDFSFLANHLYDLGYETVNWNLGCPFPMVTKKMRGSGMLPHMEMIREFLDDTIPNLKGSLSIKIRLGWRSSEDIFKLIPVLNAYPIKELIIHPRTGVQGYNGDVDLDAFETCLSLITRPVVYNGDIRTFEDFERLSHRFHTVHRWMLGRGCISDPFLPGAIKAPGELVPDKIEKLKKFHNALFDAYSDLLDGPSHVMNKMKGLWRYFSLLFIDCGKAVKKIKKSHRPDLYLEQVNLFFETEARLRKDE